MGDQTPIASDDAAPLTSSVTGEGPEEVTEIVTRTADPAAVAEVESLMGGGASMPEVNAGAVRAAQSASVARAEPAATGAPVKGRTDDKGRPFDPNIHEMDSEGKPAINAKGWLKCKRGGAAQAAKRGGSAHQSKLNVDAKGGGPVLATGQATHDAKREAQINASAVTLTGLVFSVGQMVGGEEFAPRVDKSTGEDEPAFIQGSFENYFRARGVVDIPPGVGLAFAIGGYVFKRWNAPKFEKRRMGWWEGIKQYFRDRAEARRLAAEEGERRRKAGF